MINSIHHTSFTVSDMERSIAFYRDVLGLKAFWDSKAAGIQFKGPIADAITGCPGDGGGRTLRALLVEQNLPMALKVGDYVYVLSKGEIVYECTPAELRNDKEKQNMYIGLGV